MPSRVPFVLAAPHGSLVHGLLDLPDQPGPRPAVLVTHGFKGFMEWGFWPYVADLLATRGFTVVRFNLSGAGMRPGDERVTDLEAFAHATISGDVADQSALLEAMARGELAAGRIDPQRIGLLGHSRGGGTSLLLAASPQGVERVRALVTWSAVGRFDRLSAEEKEQWRRRGETPVVNKRTGQVLAVALDVLEDMEGNREAFDLELAAARRRAPWLIAHGTADETVAFNEGRALAAAAGDVCEFLAIEGGSHTLGAQHPFAGPTPHLIAALNATQAWFRRHL